MAEFKFSCPNCSQRMAGEDNWRGMQINCPSCNTVITVPAALTAPPPPPGLKISGQAAAPPVLASPAAPPPPVRTAPAAKSGALNIPWAGLISLGLIFMTIPANIIAYEVTHIILLGTPLLLIALFIAHGALEKSRAERSVVGRIVATIALTFGYLLLLFLGWAGYRHFTGPSSSSRISSPYVMTDNGAPQTSAGQSRPISVKPPPPPDPRVTTNPLKVEIPDAPLSGTIGGQDFVMEKAEVENGWLVLHKENDILESLRYYLNLNIGESIDGKKIFVTSAAAVPQPINISWREGTRPMIDTIINNYALRLEFGTSANGKVPVKMYLEASQSHKTKLVGTFEAVIK